MWGVCILPKPCMKKYILHLSASVTILFQSVQVWCFQCYLKGWLNKWPQRLVAGLGICRVQPSLQEKMDPQPWMSQSRPGTVDSSWLTSGRRYKLQSVPAGTQEEWPRFWVYLRGLVSLSPSFALSKDRKWQPGSSSSLVRTRLSSPSFTSSFNLGAQVSDSLVKPVDTILKNVLNS